MTPSPREPCAGLSELESSFSLASPPGSRANQAHRSSFVAMPTDIGVIDLGMGFPYQSVEAKKVAYDFFRPLLKDRQSRHEFEFPAEYMFKDAPDVIGPDEDPVAWTVAKMDEFGIEQAMVGLGDNAIRAAAE